MTTTNSKFCFYNKGLKKQNVAKNINTFANLYQFDGNSDAPLNPLNESQLEEIYSLLKDCICAADLFAFPGEQKALINHILECLNEDLKDYLPIIKKAALSTNNIWWEKMKKVLTQAYNEY
jgi:hypothetical protein